MTTSELQKILLSDNELSVKEVSQTIYDLMCDALGELAKDLPRDDRYWYQGEINGFQIALDLLEHCKKE